MSGHPDPCDVQGASGRHCVAGRKSHCRRRLDLRNFLGLVRAPAENQEQREETGNVADRDMPAMQQPFAG